MVASTAIPTSRSGRSACNTRDVASGSLFFCIPGLRADGHDFASQAVAAGAVALVCERALALPVTQVLVPRARHAMALMSARFYGDPTRELRVAAVTGTNGKTTTAHLLAEILAAAGLRPALLGTVVNRIAGVERDAGLTTAESTDLQRMFREMVDGGDKSCVMEASSHALALERTTGIVFESMIFTNLTRDHLDFHPTFDDYFAAKRSLFLPDERRRPGATAVVNSGDEYGRRLVDDCREAYGADLWTFALEGDARDGRGDADCAAVDLALTAARSAFTLVSPRLDLREALQIAAPARFNVANALAAATAALAMGLPFEAVREGLSGAAGVPGRVEPVRCRPALQRAGRLLAHTRFARERPARRARGHGRSPARRVRLRRRPRPRQAAADGRGRGRARRRGRLDLRQPARRRSPGDHRGGPRRASRPTTAGTWWSSPTGARPSVSRCARRGPATRS